MLNRASMLIAAVSLLTAAEPSNPAARASITLAAAASLRPALEDLVPAFQRVHPVAAQTVYGSSGKLAAQIKQGAPFDLFLSADTDFTDSLVAWGRAAGAPRVYAHGTLVLWTLGTWPVDGGLAVLRDATVRSIALPDPALAPYGRAGARALSRAGLWDAVQSRLVFAENVAQASQYVLLRSADLGFTAKSAMLSPELRGRGRWVEVDTALCGPIAQAAVAIRNQDVTRAGASADLLAWLSSPEARTIWLAHGYTP